MSQPINPKDAAHLGIELVERDPVSHGTPPDDRTFDAAKTYAWLRSNVGGAGSATSVGHILGRRGSVTAIARNLEELLERLQESKGKPATPEE
jgi:hypothetical protein